MPSNGGDPSREPDGANLLEGWGARGLDQGSFSSAEEEVSRGEELDGVHSKAVAVLLGTKLPDQCGLNANLNKMEKIRYQLS